MRAAGDPVAEVEAQVEAINLEHVGLWGCDDPACAVRSSTLVVPHEPRLSWWRRWIMRCLSPRSGE